MVKLVFLLATVSLKWNKANLFSLVGLMLICLIKEHNKRLTLVNWSKEAGIEFDKLTLQYWNVRSKQQTWLLKLLTNSGFQLKNHGAWTNVTMVVWLVKNKAEAAEQFGDEQVPLASFIRCIASCNASWWWILSSHWPSLRFAWRLSHSDAENWKWLWNVPFHSGRQNRSSIKDGKNVFVGAHGNSIRAL